MTDDELIYAANETIDQLKEYEQSLTERYRGKIAKAYGSKTFLVDEAEYLHGFMQLAGFIRRADGSTGVRRYGVPIESAEFIEP